MTNINHQFGLFEMLTLEHQPGLLRDNADDFVFKLLIIVTTIYLGLSYPSFENISILKWALSNAVTAAFYFLLRKALGWVNQVTPQKDILRVCALIIFLIVLVILL